jgi:hypothetical protein
MTPERWEAGSAFPLTLASMSPRSPWLPDGAILHGTGRQAILALLRHGRDAHGWRRLLIPSYSCPDVVNAVHDVLPIASYPCSPGAPAPPPEPRRDEVLLVTSFFGARPHSEITGANVILDVTHDPLAPWLRDVDVGYAVASLRKTLPVPDGAATWSPQGLCLPQDPGPNSGHISTVATGLRAMCLKSEYLLGANVTKNSYLRLFGKTENAYKLSAPARISTFSRHLIDSFPVHEWRHRRLANIRCLAEAITSVSDVTGLPSTFGVVIRFRDHDQREKVRLSLLERNIYPAILWPLENTGASRADLRFSQRMLFLHADFRYGERDMQKVAEEIAIALRQRRRIHVD